MIPIREKCQRLLGDERFKTLEERLDALPSDVDLDQICFVVEYLERGRQGHKLLDPAWTQRRDEAYKLLDQAILRVKGVLRERDLDLEVEGLEAELARLRNPRPRAEEADRQVDQAIDRLKTLLRERGHDGHVRGLEDELARLREVVPEMEHGPGDWRENTRMRLLAQDRASLGWGSPGRGRHLEPWRAEGVDRLSQILGRSTELTKTQAIGDAMELLRDIGLRGSDRRRSRRGSPP